MNKTSIEWTDFSANPLKYRDADGRVVWACVHASPGCQHCYAETLAKRYGKGGPFNVPTTLKVTPFLDDHELRQMLTYKPARGKRVFVGDMTDIFGEWAPDELLDRLFAVLALRTDVTWQVLTKRAERMRQYFARLDESTRQPGYADWPKLFDPAMLYLTELLGPDRMQQLVETPDASNAWPLPNVWLGVSVEDQDRLERVDKLKDTPAAVRFVSFEPLLEDLGGLVLDGIQWGIVGGESGAGARPCHLDWIRSVVWFYRRAGLPLFVKQLGSDVRGECAWPHHAAYPPEMIDRDGTITSVSGRPGTLCHALDDAFWPCRLKTGDRKGGVPAEWPEDLRVREFPR